MKPRHILADDEIRHAQEMESSNLQFMKALVRTYPHIVPQMLPGKNRKPEKRAMPEGLERTIRQQKSYRDESLIVCGPIARKIVEDVGEWFNLEPDTVRGRCRKRFVISARFTAIKLLSDVRNGDGERRFSYPVIGNIFGGRDHSTIMHAVKTFDHRAVYYPEMRECYEALRDN